MPESASQDWLSLFRACRQPQVLALFFLGLSAGLPLLLIFSSLSLWLREAGVDRSTVTFFSWAALGYSFKFVWAPLVDRLPLPWLGRVMGQRRSWLLLSQIMIMSAIGVMAFSDPGVENVTLVMLAVGAVLLGFSSATQDIVIDAYRIECAPVSMQGLLSAFYIGGYRVGMLVSGAGSLYLASYLGSSKAHYLYHAWRDTYLLMAAVMLVGVVTTFLIREPEVRSGERAEFANRAYGAFFAAFVFAVFLLVLLFNLSSPVAGEMKSGLALWLANPVLAGFVVETLRWVFSGLLMYLLMRALISCKLLDRELVRQGYWLPVAEFFQRFPLRVALLFLLLVGFYRVSDIVLGVISNVFYLDMGFSKNEIATVVKVYGVLMALAGSFFGGVLVFRWGVMPVLMLGAVLAAATNLLFLLLAHSGHDFLMLSLVISADNFSAGIASAAFVAFLSALTNISFTAVQYAIFSSLMTLFPKILGGYSGSVVNTLGYETFFLLTAVLGLPVLLLVYFAGKHFHIEDREH